MDETHQMNIKNLRRGETVIFRGNKFLFGGIVNKLGYVMLGWGCLTSGLIIDPDETTEIQSDSQQMEISFPNAKD